LPSESGGESSAEKEGSVSSDINSVAGPFSISIRLGIMIALLGSKKATFTELLLAVKSPKSTLNKNLGILEDYGFVEQRRGFALGPGPRTIIKITPKGEEATAKHLEFMRALADKYLASGKETAEE